MVGTKSSGNRQPKNNIRISATSELLDYIRSRPNPKGLPAFQVVARDFLQLHKEGFVKMHGQECFDEHMKRYSRTTTEMKRDKLEREKKRQKKREESNELRREELELKERELSIREANSGIRKDKFDFKKDSIEDKKRIQNLPNIKRLLEQKAKVEKWIENFGEVIKDGKVKENLDMLHEHEARLKQINEKLRELGYEGDKKKKR